MDRMKKFIPLLVLWQLYAAAMIWRAQPAMKAWWADVTQPAEASRSVAASTVPLSGTVTVTTVSTTALPPCDDDADPGVPVAEQMRSCR